MTGLDPALWFFVLGIVAAAARSPFRLPAGLGEVASAYLLIAIGLKGGLQLAGVAPGAIALQSAGVLALGVVTPLATYFVASALARFARTEAAMLAAHYGSTSVMTFVVATGWLAARGIGFEPHAAVFVVLLEVPGIVIGLALARRGLAQSSNAAGGLGLARELLLGKSVLLLAGGLVIGAIIGPQGAARIAPVFTTAFPGILCIYLLDLGALAVAEAPALRRRWPALLMLGIALPVAFGALGVAIGGAVGLSPGGAMLLGVLGASASYIAAPAAVRVALPDANVGLALSAALCVTFPFNVFLGIPLYARFAGAT